MAEHIVDLSNWPRADQFRFFRTYQRPHYAVTARIDVSAAMRRKSAGLSVYRACLWGIGAGIHGVPELCMRFRGDRVVRHDAVELSMSVPVPGGSFNYAYVPYLADFADFDSLAAARIAAAARGGALQANAGQRDDVAYLSCLPWLDYSAINNALPGPDDCIPRVSWGKIVENGGTWDMAMTLEVHHALVDGEQVAAYFAAVQQAMD
jgi:chloramphenicol O-acetyltransferase type A